MLIIPTLKIQFVTSPSVLPSPILNGNQTIISILFKKWYFTPHYAMWLSRICRLHAKSDVDASSPKFPSESLQPFKMWRCHLNMQIKIRITTVFYSLTIFPEI